MYPASFPATTVAAMRLLRPILLLAASLALHGCTWFQPASPMPKPVPVVNATNGMLAEATTPAVPADPSRFPWEDQVIEATGRADAKHGRSGAGGVALRLRAKTDAIGELLDQVKPLPVHGEATVGQAMSEAIAVKKAVEDAVKSGATSVSEDKLPDGDVEARFQLPLSTVADALRRFYITPAEPLPEPPQSDPGRLLPVI